MKKLIFIVVALLSFFCFSHPSYSSEKELNIAMVLWRGITDAEKGFQAGLKEFGYSTRYTIIDAKQDRAEFAGLLRNELEPRLAEFDYIYSFGTTASQMVKLMNNERVPHIFNIVTDPVKADIARNMDSAGKNISGISHQISLRLQLKKARKIKPFKTLGFLFNSREKNSNIIREELQLIAKSHQFKLIELRTAPVRNILDKNLIKIEDGTVTVDAVYLPTDSYLVSNADLIGSRLKKAGVVSFGAQKEYISEGVLMGLVPDYYKLGKNAASILDRHQKGEKLKDIPVHFETNPKLMINETTRKHLGIRIPDDILKNAIVIE